MEDSATISCLSELHSLFHDHCRPGSQWLGVESEKFGVMVDGGAPISYQGQGGDVLSLLKALIETGRWVPLREDPSGPLLGATRRWLPQGSERSVTQSITLEPGGQLELSGAPLPDAHQVADEMTVHLAELEAMSEPHGVKWLGVGFRPVARTEQLPWVPKSRYAIMREYFPRVGTRGLDMMRRTATVQVNVDYHDEGDAMRKLMLGLRIAPVLTALFANSPFIEGAIGNNLSERAAVWLDTDSDRAGLIPSLWRPGVGFGDYVEWALDVPMYLFKRDGRIVANTGQTFRSFVKEGFEGHRATQDDWLMHLATLFPDARLKTTIEMRSVDSLPRQWVPAVAALWAGLLYDRDAFEQVVSRTSDWEYEEVAQMRRSVPAAGLSAPFRTGTVKDLAVMLVNLSMEGLRRRDIQRMDGRDERVYLEPVAALAAEGRCPADQLIEQVRQRGRMPGSTADLLDICGV